MVGFGFVPTDRVGCSSTGICLLHEMWYVHTVAHGKHFMKTIQ